MSKIRTGLRVLASRMPGNSLRVLLFRLGGVKIGRNVKLPRGTTINKNVVIEDGVDIGTNVFIGSETRLHRNSKIESDVSLYRTEVGEHTKVHKGAVLWGSEHHRLNIGDHSTIGFHSILDGSEKLEVGDFVHVSNNVGVWTHSAVHCALRGIRFQDEEYQDVKLKKPVMIGNNAWVGGGVTIYPGVTIAHHSVTLPGSVVAHDVAPNTMVGGSPATVKKRIEIHGDDVVFRRTDE